MRKIYNSPISGSVYADDRDPDAGNASHTFRVRGATGDDVGTVQFQHGPRALPDSTPGLFDVHVLSMVLDRMRGFQEGPFAHPSNDAIARHIEDAIAHLEHRTMERNLRGVLGKNIK